MKKATMEDKEMTFISSSNGWRTNRNYFQLCQGNFIKGNMHTSMKDELNCQWHRTNIDRYPVCITVELILTKKLSKGWSMFLGTLFFLLLDTFDTPSLLAALHFGIASLQYPCHLSVGCWYGTRRYADTDNLPCVDLQSCPVLTGKHAKYTS